jgi:preprotein translocase subunit YajC
MGLVIFNFFSKRMLEKFGVKNTCFLLICFIFIFCIVTFEKIRVQHTCLIVDLVNGEAVQTTAGLYFANRYASDIDEVEILSTNFRVKRKRDESVTEYSFDSILSESEAEEVEEENEIPFLPPALLGPSVHVILDDDSRSPSPGEPKRKGRGKGKKNLKQ